MDSYLFWTTGERAIHLVWKKAAKWMKKACKFSFWSPLAFTVNFSQLETQSLLSISLAYIRATPLTSDNFSGCRALWDRTEFGQYCLFFCCFTGTMDCFLFGRLIGWHRADDCGQPVWCGKQKQSKCQNSWWARKKKNHEHCGKQNDGKELEPSTKFQRKSHLVLTFGWNQIWKGFPSHLVPERPREQSVVVSFHDNEEQGHVSSFPCPIPVQVHPQTHLVAVLCSVESWKSELFVSKASFGEKKDTVSVLALGKR